MQLKFKVNGQNWKIKTVDADAMQEEGAYDAAGLCMIEERTILIDHNHIDFPTVCHELYHAYFSYLHLDDTTELKIGDFEEITASHFAANAEEILKKAKELTKSLQKGE
jgi:hypothetical protein